MLFSILGLLGTEVGAGTINTTAYDAFVAQMQATSANYAAAQAAQLKAVQEQQSKAQILQLLVQSCPFFHKQSSQPMPGPEKKIKKTARTVTDAAFEAREEEGFVYEKDLDQNISKAVGKDASATFAEGCDHFMNKDGKMGPWGSWAFQLIKDKPKSFGANIPDDITKWCPNYPNMSKGQRDLFWVWTMMAMSSSESSCKPKNDNPNAPNGTAVGLFQLESRVCPKASDLHNPNQNITCAVDLLASELDSRDNLMTPTSKGSKGTYWGPLRSDDYNKKRGGDIKGAQKTRALMKEYRYCKGNADASSGVAAKDGNSDKANKKDKSDKSDANDKTDEVAGDSGKPDKKESADSKRSPAKSESKKMKPKKIELPKTYSI